MSHQPTVISPRVIIQMLLLVVLVPFLPLLISGDWSWWEAWVYAIICVLGFAISRLLAARRHAAEHLGQAELTRDLLFAARGRSLPERKY
jgi:hypothetical protein